MKKLALLTVISLMTCITVVACHADENDVAGQAGELSDSVRRQNAIANLHRMYSSALADSDGNRAAAAPAAVAADCIGPLVQTYIDNRADNQNGIAILALLQEMRDPASIPALLNALNWRVEVSEEHAISAAQTLQFMDVPADKKGEVITGLGESLDRVDGARGVDNRMRIQFIRALGALEDRAATPALTKVALTQSESQNFLINRLAAQKLGELGDPAAVDAMIQGLFIFSPTNPAMRMNDVAAEALVRIGRPSLAPLLAVLNGEHEMANATATAYIEAIRQRDENAASQMSVRMVTSGEATFALGALGFREALAPLNAETQSEDRHRKVNGCLALVRLNHAEGDLATVRDTLNRVYGELPDDIQGAQARAQLIAAMRHLYDPGMLDFFMGQASDTDLHPAVRVEAVTAYAMLANQAEAARMTAFIAAEPTSEDGGFRENFSENTPALASASACNEDLACWILKLDDSEKVVVRKAAYMIGRFGRGNADAITALIAKLNHNEIEIRLSAIQALDRVATEGSQAAIDKIAELRESEEGRAIWTQFSREALPTQARLVARMGS